MSVLYLVGTPIGNLEDITLRALRILEEVSLIAAEDTRVTRGLLEHYGIKTKLVSFHEYSEKGRLEKLLQTLQQTDVALVTDAGMPGLSDPGYRLVRECIAAGVRVVPIPGPSAAITALITSGLPAEEFIYLGFLPRKEKARKEKLSQVARQPYSIIIFEAPHRLAILLSNILDLLGDRQICIGRELTKYHEEIWRGSVSKALDRFTEGDVRGEFTLVLAGSEDVVWDEKAVVDALKAEILRGESTRTASESIAVLSGWRKREVYRLALDLAEE